MSSCLSSRRSRTRSTGSLPYLRSTFLYYWTFLRSLAIGAVVDILPHSQRVFWTGSQPRAVTQTKWAEPVPPTAWPTVQSAKNSQWNLKRLQWLIFLLWISVFVWSVSWKWRLDLLKHQSGESFIVAIDQNPVDASEYKRVANGLEEDGLVSLIDSSCGNESNFLFFRLDGDIHGFSKHK